ncbi:MAG: GNAT family N-acetyltransferase [Epsilonproteobacteria bacterium]|nr:GNAT family N-acetyltransferase [Campylobacterota bacterium]
MYDKDRLIGAGRALADGVDCSYLCDVAVHPDYQGIGLGRKIVSQLIEVSKNHKKILLYSVPGKEEFYAKFGFKKMKTAMAIFKNEKQAIEWQLIGDEDDL